MKTPAKDNDFRPASDPIIRNRRERRLAWVLFLLLFALAWFLSPAVMPLMDVPPAQGAGTPAGSR